MHRPAKHPVQVSLTSALDSLDESLTSAFIHWCGACVPLPTNKKSQDPNKESLLQNSNMYNTSSMSGLLLNSWAIPSFPWNSIRSNKLPHIPQHKGAWGEEHFYQNGELPQVSIWHYQFPTFTPSNSPAPFCANSPSQRPTSKAGK